MQGIKLLPKTRVHFRKSKEFGERYPVSKGFINWKGFQSGQICVDTTMLKIGRDLGMKRKCGGVSCPGTQRNFRATVCKKAQIEILRPDTLEDYFYRMLLPSIRHCCISFVHVMPRRVDKISISYWISYNKNGTTFFLDFSWFLEWNSFKHGYKCSDSLSLYRWNIFVSRNNTCEKIYFLHCFWS